MPAMGEVTERREGWMRPEVSEERFRHDPLAHGVQRGRVWVSQMDERNTVLFSGLDRLELTVADARALRDWLTKVLPAEAPGEPVDIETLDRHLAFLNHETGRLRRRQERWADGTAERLEAIAETLTQVRRQKQMTGLSGREIG